MERHGPVGELAANRPLLMSVLIAFGASALAIVGFLRIGDDPQAGAAVARFVVNGLLAIAAPAALAAFAPTAMRERMIFSTLIAVALVAALAVSGAAREAAPWLSANIASLAVGGALLIWMIMLRPVMGAIAALAAATPLAALLGAFAAGGLASFEQSASGDFVGAVACLALALSCIVGAGLAADFSRQFAKGASALGAASFAAHNAAAPAIGMTLISSGVVLVAGEVDGSDAGWLLAAHAALGVLLALAAALFLTTATLALRATTEMAAVIENYRQRTARLWWRPFRRLLPPSSALAFVAITLILTVCAFFQSFEVMSRAQGLLIAIGAVSSAAVFVSLRTGIFVATLLVSATALTSWGFAAVGAPTPPAFAQLAALACAAGLFSQFGAIWRDARSPRRKAHEAAEAAVVDGAHRYLASAAFVVAAFSIGQISGLWPAGQAAAIYAASLAAIGFILSAPLMTALGVLFGRD